MILSRYHFFCFLVCHASLIPPILRLIVRGGRWRPNRRSFRANPPIGSLETKSNRSLADRRDDRGGVGRRQCDIIFFHRLFLVESQPWTPRPFSLPTHPLSRLSLPLPLPLPLAPLRPLPLPLPRPRRRWFRVPRCRRCKVGVRGSMRTLFRDWFSHVVLCCVGWLDRRQALSR